MQTSKEHSHPYLPVQLVENLPVRLVKDLPAQLVKNLPVQLVDCVQDDGQDEGQVRGEHGLDINEVLVGVKCEVRGVPTTSEESEIFVGIDCGVQGVINTSAESDKNSVRENTGMNKDECAECVMCSRTRRLVSGTGHWGLQLGGRGAQCVPEKVLELNIEDVREGFRDEITNSKLQKRKKSLLKKKIIEMRNRVDLENIEENLKTQGVQENIVMSGDMCEKSARVTSGDDDGHSAPQPIGAQCVHETVKKSDTTEEKFNTKTQCVPEIVPESEKEKSRVDSNHHHSNHHQQPPQARHKVHGAHKIVHTDNHQPHLHPQPPKYTKKSTENLLCDQSNKEWPLRPDLGALRYQGVQSPGPHSAIPVLRDWG